MISHASKTVFLLEGKGESATTRGQGPVGGEQKGEESRREQKKKKNKSNSNPITFLKRELYSAPVPATSGK